MFSLKTVSSSTIIRPPFLYNGVIPTQWFGDVVRSGHTQGMLSGEALWTSPGSPCLVLVVPSETHP